MLSLLSSPSFSHLLPPSPVFSRLLLSSPVFSPLPLPYLSPTVKVTDAEWQHSDRLVVEMSDDLLSNKSDGQLADKVESLLVESLLASKNQDKTLAESKLAQASEYLESSIRGNDSVGDDGQHLEHKRGAVRGSPVVPGSNFKLFTDKDNAVFVVVVLKKFLECKMSLPPTKWGRNGHVFSAVGGGASCLFIQHYRMHQ